MGQKALLWVMVVILGLMVFTLILRFFLYFNRCPEDCVNVCGGCAQTSSFFSEKKMALCFW